MLHREAANTARPPRHGRAPAPRRRAGGAVGPLHRRMPRGHPGYGDEWLSSRASLTCDTAPRVSSLHERGELLLPFRGCWAMVAQTATQCPPVDRQTCTGDEASFGASRGTRPSRRSRRCYRSGSCRATVLCMPSGSKRGRISPWTP